MKKSLWQESISYLRGTGRYIGIAVILFLLSALAGFIFSPHFTFFDSLLKELAAKVEGLNAWQLIWFIFTNNASSAFFSVVLGIFLGVVPIASALTNGALVGYVIARASALEGLGTIWRLVPHGIFELPAIFIALGLGIRLGMFVFAKKKKKELVYRFVSSCKVFLLVVIPLLVIAAIIEGILIAYL